MINRLIYLTLLKTVLIFKKIRYGEGSIKADKEEGCCQE